MPHYAAYEHDLLDHGRMVVRYYEYLSEAKINMLYGQLDGMPKPKGREIGMDLKLIKVSQKTDAQQGPSVFEKLAAVEDWIYAHEPVGTPAEPQAWIYGRLPLATTIFTASANPSPAEISEGAILFAGVTDDGEYLMMGGSAHHLTAGRSYPNAASQYPHLLMSAGPTLRNLLYRYAKTIGVIVAEEDMADPNNGRQASIDWEMIARPAKDIIEASYMMDSRGECEFLAKRIQFAERSRQSSPASAFDELLRASEPNGQRATLATPLFVALTE
ncbi:MAG: hypothetical protein JWN52_4487 [Actinomycetia bacterium]|nr:hypothetical protein [Actinomycetes bacterium]